MEIETKKVVTQKRKARSVSPDTEVIAKERFLEKVNNQEESQQ